MKSLLFRMALAVAISGTIIAGRWLVAEGPAGVARKRALPPKWDDRVRDAFFSDARSTLEGERPNFSAGSGPAATAGIPGGPAGNSSTPSGGGAAPPAGGAMPWSKIVSADTLQDEIKNYQNEVKDNVKTPSDFKGNLFKRARDDFSILATVFGVIGEYDGDVRWKDQAVTARDVFGQSGVNCKVATDQSFNDAKLRADDLAALIRGDSLPAKAGAEPKANWPKVANRPPLMHRLDIAQGGRLAPWTSNAGDFSKHLDGVLHEAEIVAMIGEVIQRDGYDFTDDKSYMGFAREMENQAIDLASAAKAKNYDQARAAAGKIAQACNNCHGGFRN
ncbi:MAG TPA: cytochrome c [Pirellulales bacterium]|jgi:hypothetical protein|nr:cytochrome c [Pirellulales bacterium]